MSQFVVQGLCWRRGILRKICACGTSSYFYTSLFAHYTLWCARRIDLSKCSCISLVTRLGQQDRTFAKGVLHTPTPSAIVKLEFGFHASAHWAFRSGRLQMGWYIGWSCLAINEIIENEVTKFTVGRRLPPTRMLDAYVLVECHFRLNIQVLIICASHCTYVNGAE